MLFFFAILAQNTIIYLDLKKIWAVFWVPIVVERNQNRPGYNPESLENRRILLKRTTEKGINQKGIL